MAGENGRFSQHFCVSGAILVMFLVIFVVC